MTIELTAYDIFPHDWAIEPAETRRGWMDKSLHGAANRCLPLTMANQMGWMFRCPVRFRATWDSNKPGAKAITIQFSERPEVYEKQIRSSFGSGILSFAMPWLFRTTEGYGLIVRGPTNTFRED